MSNGVLERDDASKRDVLSVIATSATQRIANDVRTMTARGESYTLAWPLIADVAAACNVPTPTVVAAIEAGEQSGVLRVLRDPDTQQLLAVRADPL